MISHSLETLHFIDNAIIKNPKSTKQKSDEKNYKIYMYPNGCK